MLQINGKTFMNLQEAVQWLLDNNALPFQSSANYVANTEIGLGTIINPSPAKVRIGSLIFFADSKVSTVTGLTENGFIVSDQYNDLVDDIVYVSNVAINASGHLIVTLSNGTDIDAGLIKQISNFSIDASQHLIATYNNGTTNDLGAIFTGNINISGNITASGVIDGGTVTGNEIVEKMSGYSAVVRTVTNWTFEKVYIGAVKNGNKLTFVIALNITKNDASAVANPTLVELYMPSAVGAKLYPNSTGYLSNQRVPAYSNFNTFVGLDSFMTKYSNNLSFLAIYNGGDLTVGVQYYYRFEVTFLLSNSL